MVLNEIERCAKRQLIERNRQTKQIRAKLSHWDELAWAINVSEVRSLIDETTAQYIRHVDSPLTGENKLIFRDKNMLRLMLILRAWQFGQSVEALTTGKFDSIDRPKFDTLDTSTQTSTNEDLKNNVLTRSWFELLLLNVIGRLDVEGGRLRTLDSTSIESLTLDELELQPQFLKEICALASSASEFTTEQLAIMSAVLVVRKEDQASL